MNNPIYFPFTYVPQWVAEAFAAGFRHFYVYRPSGKELPAEMQHWVEKNIMSVCVPVQSDDKTVTEVVAEFERFARLHADGKNLKMAAFWNRRGDVPFFDEISAAHIVADLKKGPPQKIGLADTDSLLRARVFLEFAQEFDRQNAEIQKELSVTDRYSKDLIKDLSGQADTATPVTRLTAEIKVDDPGEYMAQDRLKAWIRLFMEKPVDSGLLLTSSPSIFNDLIDNLTTAEKLLESKALPVRTVKDDTVLAWRKTFHNQIKKLIESDGLDAEDLWTKRFQPQNENSQCLLTLYRLPGCHPAQLFAQHRTSPDRAQCKSLQRPEIKNTLLGLIECNPSKQ